MGMFFSRTGKSIDTGCWVALLGDEDYRRIGKDELSDGTCVSTVWTGLNNNYGREKPLIFETMVFNPAGHALRQERYETAEEAKAGHERVLMEWLAKKATR